jgi:hypothetical protein
MKGNAMIGSKVAVVIEEIVVDLCIQLSLRRICTQRTKVKKKIRGSKRG